MAIKGEIFMQAEEKPDIDSEYKDQMHLLLVGLVIVTKFLFRHNYWIKMAGKKYFFLR